MNDDSDKRFPAIAETDPMGALLVETFTYHLMGPVIGRYGKMDQAISWLKGSAWAWNDAYRSDLPVSRGVLNFELGRDYSWSYRIQEKLDRNEPVDEGAAKLAYRARDTIVQFFVQHRERTFTSADICRRFREELYFIKLSDYESLLLLYVGKQFLALEGNRFRIRESYTLAMTDDRPEREEKLKRWVESLGPHAQAYLEGRGQLFGLHAKLPMQLWEEFQRDLGEFVKAKTEELVARGNSPEFEGAKEYVGGAFMMVGPYAWTMPQWEEQWKAQKSRQTQAEPDKDPSSSA